VKFYSNYPIKEDEIGRACGTYGGKEECIDRVFFKKTKSSNIA
jgi:hypothetical protein